MEARTPLDLAVVGELLGSALSNYIVHDPAWNLLLELHRKGKLPHSVLNAPLNLLLSKTGASFPEYSFDVIQRIGKTLGPSKARLNLYYRAMPLYREKQHLWAQMAIALASDLQSAGKKATALDIYLLIIDRCKNRRTILLDATTRAEDIYLASDRTDLAIKMYKKLFNNAKKPGSDHASLRLTTYYEIGKRLARLYRAIGDDRHARQVLKKINPDD